MRLAQLVSTKISRLQRKAVSKSSHDSTFTSRDRSVSRAKIVANAVRDNMWRSQLVRRAAMNSLRRASPCPRYLIRYCGRSRVHSWSSASAQRLTNRSLLGCITSASATRSDQVPTERQRSVELFREICRSSCAEIGSTVHLRRRDRGRAALSGIADKTLRSSATQLNYSAEETKTRFNQ